MKEDWVECTLGDLLKLKSGFAFKSTKYIDEGIPVLRIGDIQDWNVDVNNAKRVEENREYDPYKVNKGDILIAMSGATTGKFGIYNSDEKAYQNQRVGNLIPHSDNYTIKNYIYYLLYSLKRDIEIGAYGGAQPNISASKIEALQTKLFPLPIQRAIVAKIEELFSSLDSGIADLKKAQEQLVIYRQAVLKKAFEGELTNNSEEVNVVKLGAVIEKPRYGTSKKCTTVVHGKAVLRIPNIRNGVISTEELKYAEFEETEISTLALKEGDILTIRSNGSVDLVGKCAMINKKDEDYLFAGYLIRLRPNPEKIFSKYLLHCLSSHNLRIQIESKAKSTSGVNNINSGELESLEIPLFSLKQQHQIIREIESRLSVCDKVEESISESLEKAKALRQSILKKAFEGKLLTEEEIEKCKREKDYEPAYKLLERIRGEKKQKK